MIPSSSCPPSRRLDRSGPAGNHHGLAVVTPLTGTRSITTARLRHARLAREECGLLAKSAIDAVRYMRRATVDAGRGLMLIPFTRERFHDLGQARPWAARLPSRQPEGSLDAGRAGADCAEGACRLHFRGSGPLGGSEPGCALSALPRSRRVDVERGVAGIRALRRDARNRVERRQAQSAPRL